MALSLVSNGLLLWLLVLCTFVLLIFGVRWMTYTELGAPELTGRSNMFDFLVFYLILYDILISCRMVSLFVSKYGIISFTNSLRLFLSSICLRFRGCKDVTVRDNTTNVGKNYNKNNCVSSTDALAQHEQRRNSVLIQSFNNAVSDDWKIELKHLDLGFVVARGGYSQVYKGRYFFADVAIKNIITSAVSI